MAFSELDVRTNAFFCGDSLSEASVALRTTGVAALPTLRQLP
jgi:hypothetical protein